MQRTSRALVFVGSLLTVAALSSCESAEKPERPRAQLEWEYKVVVGSDTDAFLSSAVIDKAEKMAPNNPLPKAIELRLNELGKDGWELCGVWLHTLILKRPKR
ncbi:MAG: hypothetical protein ACYSU0_13175 [Planctomycetota bacterium]|jgi:hypothetical protein